MKSFTLCDGCSKEIEVPLHWRKERNAYFTVAVTCPHCKTFNVIYLKIVVDEQTKGA